MFNTNPWIAYYSTTNRIKSTYIQGFLDVSGNIILRNGGFSLPQGDVSMNGNLYVGLDASMNRNLYVGLNSTMRGNVNIQGNLVVNNRVLQTLSSDPSYNNVNGYYALAKQVQPIVSKQTAYDIGQNWQSVSDNFTASTARIRWSSKLGLFCSVGDSGVVITSKNGLDWTQSNHGLGNCNSVCWSHELGIFVAVSYNFGGRCSTSPDGLVWTLRTSLSNLIQWSDVCWSPELGIFVAVGLLETGGGTETINNSSVAVSRDGITWVAATSGVWNYNWRSVCWSAELGLFCAVSIYSTSNKRIMVSRDGYNWNAIGNTVIGSSNWSGICWSPELGLFCVTGYSNILVSRDGYNWTTTPTGGTLTFHQITWAAEIGLFCAVSDAGAGNNQVIVSRDGYNWITATSGVASTNWYGIAWSPELGIFCAISYGAKNSRVMITNQEYRSPTTKSIKTLLNDGNYNINIASTSSGSFPNFRTTAIGPNLISIGNGNYRLVGAALRDSIAIGNTILNASNPTGYGMVGMGNNIFPALTSGFQNIGIGNTIATVMTSGHNNVFIGNGVATSTASIGNTVAIGTGAGKTNTTGINNTYLGAFTDANSGTYNNSTAIGYGTTITASNQIKIGRTSESIIMNGSVAIGNVNTGSTPGNNPASVLYVECPSNNTNPYIGGVRIAQNTQNTSSDATLMLNTNNSTSGNPYISYDIFQVCGYSMGIDNADDTFKIASIVDFTRNANFSTNIALQIYLNDVVRINNNVLNNKMLVLWEGNAADAPSTATTFYGFGMNNSTLRYQVATTGAFHRFYCGASEVMRMTTGQNSIVVNGANLTWPSGWTGGMNVVDIACSGVHYNGLVARSDRRLKTNIETYEKGLSELMRMRPVSFTWIQHPEFGTQYGFIAQEIEEILPEKISVDENGFKSLKNNFETVIVNSIQEQQRIIEDLQNRLEALEARLDAAGL